MSRGAAVAARAGSTQRFTALDGLRGLAAFVVLVSHAMLLDPQLAAPYGPERAGPGDADGVAWWITWTPLHLFWAGSEAVFVFFVLSGFVVALPYLDAARGRSWRAYYLRRLIRLYVPVLGSVVLAVLMALVIHREVASGHSWWLNAHSVALDPRQIARATVTWTGENWLNSPLWSLGWEAMFSLLLPLYVVCAALMPRLWLLWIALLLVVTAAGPWLELGWVSYLPMFAIGTIMAAHRIELASWSRALRPWQWAVVALVSWVSLMAGWLPTDLPGGRGLQVFGAALAVLLFLGNRSAVAIGNAGIVQWLGQRSFSLYLVHEPILVTAGNMAPAAGNGHVVAALLGSIVALLVSDLFFRWVERPSHKLAQRLGRRIDNQQAAPSSAPPDQCLKSGHTGVRGED